jgi:hypothetical protein
LIVSVATDDEPDSLSLAALLQLAAACACRTVALIVFPPRLITAVASEALALAGLAFVHGTAHGVKIVCALRAVAVRIGDPDPGIATLATWRKSLAQGGSALKLLRVFPPGWLATSGSAKMLVRAFWTSTRAALARHVKKCAEAADGATAIRAPTNASTQQRLFIMTCLCVVAVASQRDGGPAADEPL